MQVSGSGTGTRFSGNYRPQAPTQPTTKLYGPARPYDATSSRISGGVGTIGGTHVNANGDSLSGFAIPPTPSSPAPIASGGGGGGGGGSAPAAAPAAPPPMTLDDFIKSNFLYTAAKNEGARRLEDYDAETLRQRHNTEADMSVRRNALHRQLDDLGQDNAESMAGRGLLRSGMTFDNQDRINAQGALAENGIAALLTNLIEQRGQGRLTQEAANRTALNSQISDLTDQFNQKQLGTAK